MTRTLNIYSAQRQRAKKYHAQLDYTLQEFRELVREALNAGVCPFCGSKITADDFGADHSQPVSRGGAHGLANLMICCQGCNGAKGPLTLREFGELLDVMKLWPGEIARNTLARLKAGARVAMLNLRGKKAA